MMYYVFNTEQEAINAEAAISNIGGVPIVGNNAKTGDPEPTKQHTTRWAVPQQRLDGKWVFPVVPDAIIAQYGQAAADYFNATFPHTKEEYNSNWFPNE